MCGGVPFAEVVLAGAAAAAGAAGAAAAAADELTTKAAVPLNEIHLLP